MARIRQVYPRVVLDPIATHDGTPAVAIYRIQSDTPSAIDGAKLPLFSYQLYDVSPHAASKVHAMSVAILIHEGDYSQTLRDPQRIDVYSFPLPAEISEEGRIAKCITHQRAEPAARMKTGKARLLYARDLLQAGLSTGSLYDR